MTVEDLIKKLESFPLEMEVTICTTGYEYLEIESFQFDDVGKTVEIVVSDLDDEY
ncbi:hypothetical protein I8752_35040 [Nostocaceae cyanobacterium CENA369]|uniref:Uncharacterized protein n=1 Tax=Dendronalium phyllosphericum CENA369 TaxID=1725256 RepID=A0A8J7IVF4_9NOST|nr:hypothetical protein [Dendronalium phyllosphericum]MBH8578072.1 hypothetical protein [Dendronalium phyllosphericum CENA369]